VRIDFHTHSSVSDGTDPPAAVMRQARTAGLDVVALTDHDTVDGHQDALQELPPGLTFVPGMELSCRLDGHSVHLLAYLFDPADAALAAETETIVRSRNERARLIVARLADLGVPVTWEQVADIAGDGVVGRPHIARALARAGVIERPADAFGPAWMGPGGPAYVRRYAPDPHRGIELVRAAGGVTVLAHPRGSGRGWQIPGEAIAGLAVAGLAGIEINHPQQDEATRAELAELAQSLGLIPTGGSDDHGELTGFRIGTETAPAGSCQRLAERASGAAPVRG